MSSEQDTAAEITPEPVTGENQSPDDGKGGKSAVLADLARERKSRQAAEKAAAELAAKVKEFEDRDKSETDRLTERLTAAEMAAAEAQSARLRVEVAYEKGLTPAQAKRLVGGTREELEADADQLLAEFPTGPRRPTPDPSQGVKNTPSAPPQLTREDVQRLVAAGRHDEVARAKAEGRLNSLLGIT